jgi:hypothetical protein
MATRIIKIIHDPPPPLSLMLRKEYFDCPQKDSHAVLYSLATVTTCIDHSLWIVTKSPKVEPLPVLIFSISLMTTKKI